MKLVDYINHLQTLINPSSYTILVCIRLHSQSDINDITHRHYFMSIEGNYESIISIIRDSAGEVTLEEMTWVIDEEEAEDLVSYDDIDAIKNSPEDTIVNARVGNLFLHFYISEDSETVPDVEYHENIRDYSIDDIYRLFSFLKHEISGIRLIVFDSNESVFRENYCLNTDMFHEVSAIADFLEMGYLGFMSKCFSDYSIDAIIPAISIKSGGVTDYEYKQMVAYLIKK